MLAVVCPVLHRYVDAPLAVSVADPPLQIEVEDEVIETIGAGLTTKVKDFVAEHPLEPMPVTE